MGIIVAAPGALLAALGLYLVTLAIAAMSTRERPTPTCEQITVTVLVPAHNEAALIARCVRSLLDQTYAAHMRRVVVVADNCTDDTAEIARSEGAVVMVRTAPDSRGKGQALRWAIDRLLADAEQPDAIAVVDADSVADRGMLANLVGELAAGRDVVQADYEMLGDQPHLGRMAGIGFVLFHRVRFFGRHRLGLPANLVGNGMLFRSDVLRRLPWNAFTPAEDLEYSIRLRLAGVEPRFASSARVWGPGPASQDGATRQRMRWEGGRFLVMWTWLGRLAVRAFIRRDFRLLDAVVDLATPPLGLLAVVAWTGLAISVLLALLSATPRWSVVPWILASASVPAFVVLGLAAVGRADQIVGVVCGAPGFLIWKVATYYRLLRGFDANRWDRTDRAVS